MHTNTSNTKFSANYIKRCKAVGTTFRNTTSTQHQFKTEVPQGGVLSSTLFNIIIHFRNIYSQTHSTHNPCRRQHNYCNTQHIDTKSTWLYNHTYTAYTPGPSQTTPYSTQTKRLVHSSLLILQNITLNSICKTKIHKLHLQLHIHHTHRNTQKRYICAHQTNMKRIPTVSVYQDG